MAVSTFDLFKIGIGPSSSHTIGPMRAARMFLVHLQSQDKLTITKNVKCTLYGSLGATGKGHASDLAVMLGLCGFEPESVDVDATSSLISAIRSEKSISLMGLKVIPFNAATDIRFMRQALPFHQNGMRFEAYDEMAVRIMEGTYYSVGGGFVVTDEVANDGVLQKKIAPDTTILPLPFHSADDLLGLCLTHNMSIAEVMRTNERYWRSDEVIDQNLIKIWGVMQACIARGCLVKGVLPGPLKVKRRAADLFEQLTHSPEEALRDPLQVLDWVNLYALAVNEENAAGGRVVTAPTNGAAGIIPAVLTYYRKFVYGSSDAGMMNFLLTAAAIGLLYKENASISGAEVGCQGEVGVACSMAAGALCAVMGGTPSQVENAAEIGMEHHLGLTCDPVGGFVQIPCIERNAIASVKAINAARMALRGDGKHFVSLDQVIKTMRETGADMKTKYKETSRGGLALNIIEC
jgi:L-serine dehydratase